MLRMRHSQTLAASPCQPAHCAHQSFRTCFPGLRKRLFRLAEEPFLRHVKGCSGVRKRLCDEPERAFPHRGITEKACPDALYSRPDMPSILRKSLFRAPPFSLSRKISVNIFYFHECIIMHSRRLRLCPVSARRRLSRQSLRSPAAHSGHSPLST